jgi:hypothetical protein
LVPLLVGVLLDQEDEETPDVYMSLLEGMEEEWVWNGMVTQIFFTNIESI